MELALSAVLKLDMPNPTLSKAFKQFRTSFHRYAAILLFLRTPLLCVLLDFSDEPSRPVGAPSPSPSARVATRLATPACFTPNAPVPMEERLNYDVLIEIASHVENRGDVLSLLHACRATYAATLPFFLSDVQLGTCTKVSMFCHWLLPDMKAKAGHISRLSIHGFCCSRGLALDLAHGDLHWDACNADEARCHPYLPPLIIRILHCTRNIVSLNFRDLEDWLCLLREPSGSLYPLAMPRLTSLGTGPAGAEVSELLSKMDAPLLTSLHISSDLRYGNIGQSLASVSQRLENITLTGPIVFTGPQLTIRCSRVQDLRLLPTTFGQYYLASLTAVFPNIVRFSCSSTHVHRRCQCLTGVRQLNKHTQVNSGAAWTKLEMLEGDVTSLYALGITRPVESLRITVSALGSRSCSYLCAVINDAQPVRLSVAFGDYRTISKHGSVGIATALRLTHLYIQLSFRTDIVTEGEVR